MATRRVAAAAAAGMALLLLAGCGGASDSGDEAASQSVSGDEVPAGGEDTSGDAVDDSDGAIADDADPGSGDGGQAVAVPIVRAEILTASLTVRVKDVEAAARRAEDASITSGGSVGTTRLDVDPENRANTTAELALRVPNPDLPDFLRTLAGLGTRLSEDRTSEDVTAEVADVESRVANARTSIERLRGFLRSATAVEDVVRIESDLTRRESELEALQARSRALADRTSLATVNLTLVAEGSAALPAEEEDDSGFLAGLDAGWDAFTASVAVALTVLGAVLPFAVLLALLAIPAWMLRGRFRRPAVRPADAPQAP